MNLKPIIIIKQIYIVLDISYWMSYYYVITLYVKDYLLTHLYYDIVHKKSSPHIEIKFKKGVPSIQSNI